MASELIFGMGGQCSKFCPKSGLKGHGRGIGINSTSNLRMGNDVSNFLSSLPMDVWGGISENEMADLLECHGFKRHN